MLSFIPLKNHSVTIGLNFSLDFMSDIILSNTIKTALFLLDYHLPNVHKQLLVDNHQLFVNNQ